ncbi:MAG: hypothetical protein A3B68_08730 [Candidatus Melainabacteria bacterium RIFCSPHIGHO2_02_FULL_34_12]|nr:MAG: hypothetical protein A3B68_08730 [Candidatus Melainabacteria bacterium RIFCSPHIGHO2_02_FULL_34_12]
MRRQKIKDKKETRQCISCRTQLPRSGFFRITKVTLPGFEKIVLNPTRHDFGRSVYLCKTPVCINNTIKEKKISKMLKIPNNNLNLGKIINELEEFKGGTKIKI